MNKKRIRRSLHPAITLRDVAEHANVSTATVSRFLTSPDQVREERRQRIQESIDALGYIPHGAAQALASQRSRTIGAVIPTLDNAIFARGIQQFQQVLQNAGYTLFISTHNYSLDEELKNAETLITRGVDGMLLIGFDHSERLLNRLKKMKLPYINAWAYDKMSPHPCIGFNNYDAAKGIANHLVKLGHKKFGVIAGITKDNDRARQRLDGTLDGLKENGIRVPDDLIFQSPYKLTPSRDCTKKIIDHKNRPTAIICGNDVIAYGAMLECQSQGIIIPKEISVVGYDDLPISKHLNPGLTTLHIPSEEMGRAAAQYLLSALKGETLFTHIELNAYLIERDSTAPPLPS